MFAAWLVLPPWLVYVTSPVALPRLDLGRAFGAFSPLALLGGVAALGYAFWGQPNAPLPMAFVAAPAVQLAVVIPFLLFTGTDKRGDGGLQES